MTRIRRILAALATFAGALLAFIAAAPATLATRVPPPGGRPDRRGHRPRSTPSSSAACRAGRSP
jgi:hypothetical protein